MNRTKPGVSKTAAISRSVRRAGGFVLTAKPEVIGSSVESVPRNALVLTGPTDSRIVAIWKPSKTHGDGTGPIGTASKH
jgi:hypothetical protein